jgi:hypothetical protein
MWDTASRQSIKREISGRVSQRMPTYPGISVHVRDTGVPFDSQDITQTIAVPVAEMNRLAVALQVVNLAVRFPVREVLGVFEQLDFTARRDPNVVVVPAAVHIAVPSTITFELHAALEPLLEASWPCGAIAVGLEGVFTLPVFLNAFME